MIESQSTILNSQSAIPTRTAPAAPVVAGLSWRQILSWTTKGSLAIADQGLFAGSNFLLNVLLARWLAPAEYGAFALAYSVFWLFGVFHSAILTEPMLVFGPGKYRERFPEYLGILLRGHFALMLPGAALLAATAFLLGWLYSPAVERAFLALAIAGPFILLLWLLRRAFYVRLNPGWSAVGGGVYLAILLAGILALHPAGRLTPATGFLAMAAASLITCLVLFALLRPKLATESSAIRAVASDHWRYGKWAAATAGPSWFSSNIYFLVLPAWFGLAEAGALKALLNLAMPALHTISALGVLLLPILVRDRDCGGPRAMSRTMKLSLALFLSGSACYLALLWGFRLQIFHFLYAGKYAEYASWPLLLVGLLPFAQSLPNVMGGGLRALEQPHLVFWCSVGSGTVALALGVPFASSLGVGGALVGLLLSFLVAGVLMLWFYRRSWLQPSSGASRRRRPSPKAKYEYLRSHLGFRRAPLLTLFRLLCWRVRCWLKRPATIRLHKWGAQLFLPAKWQGAGTTMIFATREYYEPELTYLNRFLSPGAVVVDGGASCGIYTVAASKVVGETGRVLSFEPGAQSFSVLKRNVELNRLHNVRTFRMALSDTQRKARLYHHPHGPNSYCLAGETSWCHEFEEIATTTVDVCLGQEGLQHIDLLKMDVEGAEELILRGANSVIASSRPVVIFEVNPDAAARLGLQPDGAWKLLESLGYSFHRLGNEGNLARLESPPDGGNVLAIHPGKPS